MKILVPIIVLLVGLIGGLTLGIALFDEKPIGKPEKIESIRIEGPMQALPAAASPVQNTVSQSKILKLDQRLGELSRANRTLRRQLAETNRDLAELQFQVDSHSESFRPLDGGLESDIPKPFGSPDFNPILPPR